MNNEQNNKLKRMKMHENNERNAMLTKKGKKRGNRIKLQQGGAGSRQGMLNSKRKVKGGKARWALLDRFARPNGFG